MKVSILGCGWLGLPLGKHLVENGYEVNGSVTSDIKENILIESGIKPYVVRWDKSGFNGNLISFLKTEVLIITVPPSKAAVLGGLQQMTLALLPYLEKASIIKVIFISSISVYGNNSGTVTEETPVAPETAGAKDIVAAEAILQAAPNFKATIIRFGGLIGPDRHPVNSLSGKENVADAYAPINLIHLDDCVGIIETILKKEAWGNIFNGVTPFHPKKNQYYTDKALSRGLKPPGFSQEDTGTGKVVLASKVRDLLHYTFTVTDTI